MSSKHPTDDGVPTKRGAKQPSRISRAFDALLWAASITVLVLALWPNNSGPKTGKEAPHAVVKLISEDGDLDVGTSSGKPVLIEAFASWCGACKRNRGLFNSLTPLVESGQLEAIAVSVDSTESAARSAMNSWPIEGVVAHDTNGEFGREFSVSVLPTYIYINASGEVEEVATGGVSPAQLERWVGDLRAAAAH